jgi:hypothetical protein
VRTWLGQRSVERPACLWFGTSLSFPAIYRSGKGATVGSSGVEWWKLVQSGKGLGLGRRRSVGELGKKEGGGLRLRVRGRGRVRVDPRN